MFLCSLSASTFLFLYLTIFISPHCFLFLSYYCTKAPRRDRADVMRGCEMKSYYVNQMFWLKEMYRSQIWRFFQFSMIFYMVRYYLACSVNAAQFARAQPCRSHSIPSYYVTQYRCGELPTTRCRTCAQGAVTWLRVEHSHSHHATSFGWWNEAEQRHDIRQWSRH